MEREKRRREKWKERKEKKEEREGVKGFRVKGESKRDLERK